MREGGYSGISQWLRGEGWMGALENLPEEQEPTSAGSQVVVKPISTACHMEKGVFSYYCHFL